MLIPVVFFLRLVVFLVVSKGLWGKCRAFLCEIFGNFFCRQTPPSAGRAIPLLALHMSRHSCGDGQQFSKGL